MQRLAQRLWSPTQRFHVGDLAWGRHSVPGAEEAFRTALWEAGGDVVGWGWVHLPGQLKLLVDPAYPNLVDEVLDWFAAVAAGPKLSCRVMETDAQVRSRLEDRGYRPRRDGPFFTKHVRTLTDLPPVRLPDGFTITRVGPGDAERRAAAHRAGWSDFGSRMSAESYARLMRTYPYRSETDLVVVAPDGSWVASALGWYDEGNRTGLVEPVSCAREHRRHGLARAVNVALLHAFHALGAISVVVQPRGDDAYPGPGRLYRGLGYRPGARTVDHILRADSRKG